MDVQPYIRFNGNCREAVEYYASVFGTDEPRFMTYGEIPGIPASGERAELILHVTLEIGGRLLRFSDATPDQPTVVGGNITLLLAMEDEELLKSIFNQLKEDGAVDVMDLQQTFFSKCYGSLTDRYGTGWQFSLIL